jgi:hypothetical protein
MIGISRGMWRWGRRGLKILARLEDLDALIC